MRTRLLIPIVALAVVLAACGGSDETTSATDSVPDTVVETAAIQPTATESNPAGLRLVSADDAATALASRTDLVLLDVRTPEEFADGHVDGATLIDFYGADFADQLAELDRDASYVVYCRSGNRSGQTVDLMQQLGFTDVQDVEGGVLAWADAGLSLIAP